MAAKGSPNIYDIDFAVLDERKYRGAVRSTPKPVEEISTEPDTTVVEPIGRVALSVDVNEGALTASKQTEIAIDIPKPAEALPPYVPPEYVELTQATLDTLLETYTKPVIPINFIVDVAFGQKPSKQDYENLKNALKQDPRLEYLGSRDFKVVGVEPTEVFWPGESPFIDSDKVDELAERIIKDITGRGLGKIFHWQIMERVRSDYLNSDEANELLAQVAGNQGISAYENSSFSARLTDEELQDSKDNRQTLSPDFDKPEIDNETPMTWHQVNRTLKDIRHSPNFKRMKADTKRLENPRRRGRKKKSNLQGRTHNKAKRVQQLIAQMAETTPKSAIAAEALKVEEPAVDSIEVSSFFEIALEDAK